MAKQARTANVIDAEFQRLLAAVDAAGDIAYDWDLPGQSIAWLGSSELRATLVGGAQVTSAAEFLRRISPDDVVARRRALNKHLATGVPFDCLYRIVPSGLEPQAGIWLHERGAVVRDADGEARRLIGTIRSVTARREDIAGLRYESEFDPLTGLLNRARLALVLDKSMSTAEQRNTTGAYFQIGVDRMSVINTAFGYSAGDTIMRSIGERLSASPAIADGIGRLSGDSFGMVVNNVEPFELEAVADRIFERLRAAPVNTPSGPIYVTVSIGGVEFPNANESAADCMQRAEHAMVEAKHAGRNCFARSIASDQSRNSHRETVAIAEQVREAVRERRLIFAYQPIVVAGTGEVAHYECLLRMVDPAGVIVPAGVFIPVIEQMGLARPVDRLVLEMAVRDLEECSTVRLAINLSGHTVLDSQWLARLRALVGTRRSIAERLILEITETVALRDLVHTAEFVTQVRSLGCVVALDDFGSGYMSIRNLRALPVDEVKIDGSFIKNVTHSQDNQVLVRSLVGLAQGFRMKVVAECVESNDDAEYLKTQGIDFMQGYYFGRPQIEPPWRAQGSAQAPARKVAVGG
ncbi:MAG: putative bifunctional diguanylate cyclase/phosphodiesterase [Alphaproteobacteria bacterium]